MKQNATGISFRECQQTKTQTVSFLAKGKAKARYQQSIYRIELVFSFQTGHP
jgi:hypothetical protein